jgi:hypothetical protein
MGPETAKVHEVTPHKLLENMESKHHSFNTREALKKTIKLEVSRAVANKREKSKFKPIQTDTENTQKLQNHLGNRRNT